MRIKSLKLTNYIGIYNGMGINEIFIDFSKCKHKLTIIRGDNGSGKSTILRAINPLPDSNDAFIPKMNASKEIEIYDGDILYFIKILHPVKQDGERDTTKAYIYRMLDGMHNNLNPNGNVSSFKDILHSEFKLDSNFVALTQLGCEDRGLADKRPGERKKFVNAILENLDTYNNINKVMSKRSSIFKSMINTITSKLDNLGDLTTIQSSLISIEQRIQSKEAEKNNLTEALATSRSIINITDPDGDIQAKYGNLVSKTNETNSKINSMKLTLSKSCVTYGIDDLSNLSSIDEELKSRKADLTLNIQLLKSKLSTDLAAREAEAKSLEEKMQRLQSIQNTDNYSTIIRRLKICETAIEEEEKIFSEIGIKDAIKISKDEYISALNILKEIKHVIDIFKDRFDYAVIEETLSVYIPSDSYPDIVSIESQINQLNTIIQNARIEMAKTESLIEVASKLKYRPSNCTIDTCDFIKDALEAQSTNPENRMDELNCLISSSMDKKQILNNELIKAQSQVECINYVKIIIRNIKNNNGILSKLPNGDIYSDYMKFFTVLLSGETFDYIDKLYSYINYANIFEEYKLNIESMNKLTQELEMYNSKSSIIDSINSDIDIINNKLNLLTRKIDQYNIQISLYERELIEVSDRQIGISSMIVLYTNILQEENMLKTIQNDISSIESNISKIQSALNTMSSLRPTLTGIDGELKSLQNDKDNLNYAIRMNRQYTEEKAVYSAKYLKIERLKYHSASSTGIQLVFMDIYMHDILNLANELLQYLFEGRFVIQPFSINEDEFRIPCLGNGFMNDDIKSLSNGELSMVSMIISFSLLYQSSTKYNILKLDEIDAPLDNTNRMQFLFVLDKLIDILESEQCIMISHNTELDTNDVDVIVLRTSSNENIKGNVIYNFQ